MKKASPPSRAPAPRRTTKRREEDVVLPDFRDLVDNAVQGILVHRNFRPLYANESFARLFGYEKASSIMALPLIRPLVPADLWPQVEQDYDNLVHGLEKRSISRTRGVRLDGSEIWIAATERVIDWHGTPAVQINAFDITDRMKAEHSMLASEQRLRSMLEILPVPITITRWRDGQILFVNRKTCLLFQQGVGRLLHSKATDLFVEPEEHANLINLLESVPDIREVEVRMKTAQGRDFIAELAAIQMDYSGEKALLISLNDISQRKQLENELFEQANTDSLTGLSNRRHFLLDAEQEMRRAKRFSRALSVMMIDLDHFKPINDAYGHAVGDNVLQSVVKTALESLRHSDVMGRLGGEEFAVLLPETPLAAAMDVADRLRAHIAERPFVTVKGIVPCTVSVGVAQMEERDATIDDLLHRADDAMYRAKNNGRDRVVSDA